MKLKTFIVVCNLSDFLFGTSFHTEEDGGYERHETYKHCLVFKPNGKRKARVSVFVAFFVLTFIVVY